MSNILKINFLTCITKPKILRTFPTENKKSKSVYFFSVTQEITNLSTTGEVRVYACAIYRASAGVLVPRCWRLVMPSV